jgi:hypothetical protein
MCNINVRVREYVKIVTTANDCRNPFIVNQEYVTMVKSTVHWIMKCLETEGFVGDKTTKLYVKSLLIVTLCEEGYAFVME